MKRDKELEIIRNLPFLKEQWKWMGIEAEKRGTTRPWLIRDIIEYYIKKTEEESK